MMRTLPMLSALSVLTLAATAHAQSSPAGLVAVQKHRLPIFRLRQAEHPPLRHCRDGNEAAAARRLRAIDPMHEPKTPLTATNHTALLAISDEFPLSNKANLWAKQNSITVEQLSHLFHASEGKFEIIATHIPGKGSKEKVLNAYLLVGLSKFLEAGISDFDDASGRSLCQTFGCYNNRHHVEAFKGVNELTGSQSRGWMLTAPGLKAAALLVNELSKSDDR